MNDLSAAAKLSSPYLKSLQQAGGPGCVRSKQEKFAGFICVTSQRPRVIMMISYQDRWHQDTHFKAIHAIKFCRALLFIVQNELRVAEPEVPNKVIVIVIVSNEQLGKLPSIIHTA
eukprot:4589958-Pleurochrysis_carterae.AAC.2